MNMIMPVDSIEMQEYLFSHSLGIQSESLETSELRKEIRKCFRFQRFAVMNWLLMNGVSIPADLLTDDTHPKVGEQFPDKKCQL